MFLCWHLSLKTEYECSHCMSQQQLGHCADIQDMCTRRVQSRCLEYSCDATYRRNVNQGCISKESKGTYSLPCACAYFRRSSSSNAFISSLSVGEVESDCISAPPPLKNEALLKGFGLRGLDSVMLPMPPRPETVCIQKTRVSIRARGGGEGGPYTTHRFVGFSLLMSLNNLALVLEVGCLVLGKDMSCYGVRTDNIQFQRCGTKISRSPAPSHDSGLVEHQTSQSLQRN